MLKLMEIGPYSVSSLVGAADLLLQNFEVNLLDLGPTCISDGAALVQVLIDIVLEVVCRLRAVISAQVLSDTGYHNDHMR